MSVIPLPMCKRCGNKPATTNDYCDTCWPAEKVAVEAMMQINNSQQDTFDNFGAIHN
jgi:hypothetical protein